MAWGKVMVNNCKSNIPENRRYLCSKSPHCETCDDWQPLKENTGDWYEKFKEFLPKTPNGELIANWLKFKDDVLPEHILSFIRTVLGNEKIKIMKAYEEMRKKQDAGTLDTNDEYYKCFAIFII